MRLNNFGADGSIFTKLFQTTCREAGVIICVQFLEGLPPKIWEGQKTSKFRRHFWQLSTLIANISGTDLHIEHLKKTWSTTTTSSSHWTKEIWWTLVPKQKSYSAHIDLPELHVHCKLMQIHTPRGSRILFLIRQLPLLREEFRISKLTFHSDLRRRAASRLALPCTSNVVCILNPKIFV